MGRDCTLCVHYGICVVNNSLTNPYACKRYREKARVVVYIDWDEYDEALLLLDEAKTSLNKLRDSQTKYKIAHALNTIEKLLNT